MSGYLAIDIGASGGKAIIGEYNGSVLKLQEVGDFPNEPVYITEHLYWDILSLFKEVVKITRKALHSSKEISSLAIDTWGVDFGLLDKNGHLVENPYHYRDSLTKDIMKKVFRKVPKSRIYEITATHFEPFNTIFQLAALKEHQYQSLHIANTVLLIPNLLSYFLTGEKSCEFTIATTTQLFNVTTGDWSDELISSLQIPCVFPTIYKPATIIGEIQNRLIYDIPQKLKVVLPASHDTASAVAGTPLGRNSAFMSTGTWCIVGIENEVPLIRDELFLNNFANEGCLNGNYRILKNINGLWLVDRCLQEWKGKFSQVTYEMLIAEAEESKPFRCIIDPNDPVFLNPPSMVRAIENYCKSTSQPVPESRGEFIRTILESIALRVKWVLDILRKASNKKLEEIYMVGGGTKNRLLHKFTANATNLPVIIGHRHATLIGNIISQMIAEKEVRDYKEGRELIRRSFRTLTYLPDSRRESWEEAYEKFLELKSNL